jgi:hypothetical protein
MLKSIGYPEKDSYWERQCYVFFWYCFSQKMHWVHLCHSLNKPADHILNPLGSRMYSWYHLLLVSIFWCEFETRQWEVSVHLCSTRCEVFHYAHSQLCLSWASTVPCTHTRCVCCWNSILDRGLANVHCIREIWMSWWVWSWWWTSRLLNPSQSAYSP